MPVLRGEKWRGHILLNLLMLPSLMPFVQFLREICAHRQGQAKRHLIASWGFGCKLGVALQSVELCDSSESEDWLGQAQVAAFLLSFTLVLCAV